MPPALLWEGHVDVGQGTNNIAEYAGLLLGLHALCERGLRFSVSAPLFIFGDSMVVIRQLRGEYQARHPSLVPLLAEARALLDRLGAATFVHIPREANAWADCLAGPGFSSVPLGWLHSTDGRGWVRIDPPVAFICRGARRDPSLGCAWDFLEVPRD